MWSEDGEGMKITQVELKNVGHPAYIVCWLPHTHGKPKKGWVVSLENGMWEVMNVYSTQDHYDIKRGWKVGGLG